MAEQPSPRSTNRRGRLGTISERFFTEVQAGKSVPGFGTRLQQPRLTGVSCVMRALDIILLIRSAQTGRRPWRWLGEVLAYD